MVRIFLENEFEDQSLWRYLPLSDPKLKALSQNVRQFYQSNRGSKNLIIFDDSLLCVWDNTDQRLMCLKLDDDKVKSIQHLGPTNPPIFDIDWLIISPNGKYLALQGARGINIMEMPRKWSPLSAYENGKNSILCRSFPLAERFFVCNQKVTVLEARWHPGSPTYSHMAILTDDDCLRICDVTNPQIFLLDIRLSTNNLSYSKYAASLGQTAVSFDFGPPLSSRSLNKTQPEEISLLLSPSSPYNVSTSSSSFNPPTTEKRNLIWPIYVLRGNGDVILVHNNLENSYTSRRIYGPLTMRPPAEDNYGVDASSLICLDTNPPIIVIATSSMILYHCIAMDVPAQSRPSSSLGEYLMPGETIGRSVALSPSNGVANFSRSLTPGAALLEVEEESYSSSATEPILYVLESLELVLSLTSIADQDLISPVRLHKSSASPQIYSCCHEAGIYLVNVPFIQQLKQNDFMVDELDPSIVEYLICTKPISSSSASFSIPLGIASRPKRGHFLVAVLLSTGEILTQKMTSIYLNNLNYLDQPSEEQKLDPSVSFSVYINQILKRSMNTPLIKSEINEEPDMQVLLLVLMNATEVIRKEYLVRMEKASEILAKRAKSLISSKDFQFEELTKIESEQDSLQQDVELLGNRFNKVFSRQEQLSQRVEKVLETLQIRLNHLSDSENACKSELEELSKIIEAYRNRLDQIKMKIKYQEAIREKNQCDERNRFSYLSKQIQSIRAVLSHQGKTIQELVSDLNSIRKSSPPQATN